MIYNGLFSMYRRWLTTRKMPVKSGCNCVRNRELIQFTTNNENYIKIDRRIHFKESEITQKKDSRWMQNVQEMALKSSTSGETTVENILSYSSISGDATVCEQQFSRLKNFIHDSSEPYKEELQSILFPSFVHIYLQLLCNGHKTPAHKFYSRHIKLFENDASLMTRLESLHKLYSRSDVMACKEATEFRDLKYKLNISEEAFDYLKRHIKTEDNMMLFQVFNQFLKVDVKEVIMTSLDLREGTTESLTSVSDTRPKQSEVIQNLQQSIKKVREGPPCLSSICFYTFINAYQGLCTVDISPDKTVLSAGFEDSTVKLWSITPGLIHSKQVKHDPSMLFIAADYWNLTEDSDTESKTQYREVAIMRGHNGAVYKTCFTSDSKYLLSSSEDSSVRLWDLETHTNKVCYIGHNYPVWDIDTSSVGSYFVSASQDRTAKLWITDRTYPLRTFCGHTFDVDCVKFHPNCNYIATGSSDKTVRLWSLQDGKSVRLMQGHRGTILAIAFAPNGQYLASAGDDKRVRLWDLSTGGLVKEFKGHTDSVHSLSFNKDSTLLASGGLDCCIRIWDVRKGTSYNVTQQDSHTSPELLGAFPTKSATVTYLQFAQYNLLLAAGSI